MIARSILYSVKKYISSKKAHSNRGFTLVEIIVVLVCIAILAVVAAPPLIGYIEKLRVDNVILECRAAVLAADSLYGDRYVQGGVVTPDDIRTLANVPGSVSHVSAPDYTVLHLSYSRDGVTVTYCKEYHICQMAGHSQSYNLVEGADSPDTPDPAPDDNDENYFYIGQNPRVKVKTLGDIETFDGYANGVGVNLRRGDIFYYRGNYYMVREYDYLSAKADKADWLSRRAVRLNISDFVIPSRAVENGDIKYEDGRAYVFTKYSDGWADAWAGTSWWALIETEEA